MTYIIDEYQNKNLKVVKLGATKEGPNYDFFGASSFFPMSAPGV
jgi:hypothetical protein